MRVRMFEWIGIVGLAMLLLPALAGAQGGIISGSVSDTTGEFLPGVLVEAESPAMLGVNPAYSDDAGRYTIINLRPGDYIVTFTLPGFTTVIREGIVIVGTAAVQVNAQLPVGTVEESLTVTGATPTVDVQQVSRQAVLTQQELDAIPTTRSFGARALLIPGVRNTGLGEQQYWPTAHGSETKDSLQQNDGMQATSVIGDGNYPIGWEMNEAATQEMTFQVGAAPAEMATGGLTMNAIPKEGGNTFSGTWFTYYGHGDFQGTNVSDEVRPFVGAATNRLGYDIDTNPAFGGPIIQDKLWFFVSGRVKSNKNYALGQFFKTGPLGMGRDGEQAFTSEEEQNGLVRLTHQVSARHKWRLGFERNNTYHPFDSVGGITPPETSNRIYQPAGKHAQVRYTGTLTNRLLVEAGFSLQYNRWRRDAQEVVRNDVLRYDFTTGILGGSDSLRGGQREQRSTVKGSLSYVTGSHVFKTGVEDSWGWLDGYDNHFHDVILLFTVSHGNAARGLPRTGYMDVNSAPMGTYGGQIKSDLGAYAQDAWTVDRWTLNLGVRYDYFNGRVPQQSAGAGTWVGPRSFDAVQGPSWGTVVGRFGVAYDLFGNGRTALKANLSQFVAHEGTSLTMQLNPMGANFFPSSDRRSWTDLDGNGDVFDANGVQFNEVGPSGNDNFGGALDVVTLDPDLKREGNWEYSVSLQHQLMDGLSVTGGIYRRDYYNLQFTDNLETTLDDYTPFYVNGPVDPRLPGGGGERIELWNLDPALFGLQDRYRTNSSINDKVYTGFEVSVNGRLPNGGFYGGSMTTERTRNYTCDVDNPNSLRFCDNVPPFRTFYKLQASYPLPGDVQLSGFLQGMPGPDYDANFTITERGVGLDIVTASNTLAVDLFPPDSQFLQFQTQLDIRIMRPFNAAGVRINPVVDIYNLFNQGVIIAQESTFGSLQASGYVLNPRWANPNALNRPRFLRLGLEIDW